MKLFLEKKNCLNLFQKTARKLLTETSNHPLVKLQIKILKNTKMFARVAEL